MSQEWPSIAALTASAAERFGTAPAVIDGDVTTSFAELDEEARRFGAALVATGVQPDDRVAIWAFNCREWIVADLGIQQAGATLVPVNTRFKGIEAATVLARAHVKALVTVTDFLGNDYLGMLASSGIELPDLTTTVIARGSSRDGALDWDAFLATATPEGLAEVDRRRAERRPTDPADLLFTSGTTGTPKGVIASQSQSMAVGIDWVRMAGLVPGDRYLQLNPYFHMFGLKGGILACLASGATMLPVPVFDIDAVLALVASHHVSVLPGAPTV